MFVSIIFNETSLNSDENSIGGYIDKDIANIFNITIGENLEKSGDKKGLRLMPI